MLVRICFASFLLTATAPSAKAETDHWLVKHDFWACIIDNIDSYVSVDSNVILIVEELCPETDQRLALNYGLSNMGGLPSPNLDDNSEGQSIINDSIVYNRSDLVCLKNKKIEDDNEIVRLPKRPCF